MGRWRPGKRAHLNRCAADSGEPLKNVAFDEIHPFWVKPFSIFGRGVGNDMSVRQTQKLSDLFKY
jgi:hypothetical protein